MSSEVSIQVEFYTRIQEVFGEKSMRVSLGSPATIRAALEAVCTNPQRRERIFDGPGILRKDLVILRSGRNINFLSGLDTMLESGDVVAIFPPTYGG